jgi:hypothetical protein
MAGKPHDDGNLERSFNYSLPSLIIVSNDGTALEIGKFMVELNIYEDIHKNAVSGTLILLDPNNLIVKLPLQGTERLMFKLSTPGANNDSNLVVDATEITGHPFYIYKLTDRTQVKEGVETYMLHFCSREMFRNLRTRESRAYGGDLDTSAIKIFANQSALDGRKQFKVEPTRNQDKFVMPNVRPFDAINMLASKSLSKNGTSAGYLFYETTKAFYFRSIENMFATQSMFARDEEVELVFSPKNIGLGTGKSKSLEFNYFSVDKYEFVQHYDTLANQALGTYASNIIMHNLYDKSYNTTEFNYHDNYSEEYHADKVGDRGSQHNYPVSRTPIDVDELAVSDYPNSYVSLQPTTRYLHNENTGIFGTSNEGEGLTEARRISRKNQTQYSSILRLEMAGHSYLEVGDVIKFNLPSQEPKALKVDKTGKLDDEYHSGRYLVTKLRHQIVQQGHMMILECIKDSVATKYAEEDKFPGVIKEKVALIDLYEDEQDRTATRKTIKPAFLS